MARKRRRRTDSVTAWRSKRFWDRVFKWSIFSLLLVLAVSCAVLAVDGVRTENANNDLTDLSKQQQEVTDELCKGRPRNPACVAASELPDPEEVAEQNDLDPDDPEIQDLEFNDPDPDDPEIQDPEIQERERQDPEIQDSDSNDPETQEGEIDDPDPDDPEQQDPEINDPDPNDPQDPPKTITLLYNGITITCTLNEGSAPENPTYTCTL